MRYARAARPALRDFHLQIAPGQFFGLLGPNGAGKTTFLSFLCGQVRGDAVGGQVGSTYARAQVLGQDVKLGAHKQKLGYAPQEIALFPMLSGRENLLFFARLQGLGAPAVREALDSVDLSAQADDPVATYSGGMKRRLNLGVALLNRPTLLILDEPTVGVDPQSRNFIFERILALKRDGVTVLYSTHYLEEVRRLCDHVAILQDGRLVAAGPIAEVLGQGDVESRYLELTGRTPG